MVEVDLEAEELARQIGATRLAEAREELARADGKASILLAATGVGFGAARRLRGRMGLRRVSIKESSS